MHHANLQARGDENINVQTVTKEKTVFDNCQSASPGVVFPSLAHVPVCGHVSASRDARHYEAQRFAKNAQ